MTIAEYAALAQHTASTATRAEKLGHGRLGLIGEAGEIVDVVKKHRYMGMPFSMAREKLIEELGDYWWYIIETCEGLEISVEAIYELAIGAPVPACDDMEEAVIRLAKRSSMSITIGADMIMLMRRALGIGASIGAAPEAIWARNVAKLRKRYPGGFLADASNSRYEKGGQNVTE